MKYANIIIDFDSTLVKVESLDLLAEIVLKNHETGDEIVQQIKDITQLGMEGKIDFGESLERRVELFSPKKSDIAKLVDILKEQISESVKKNIAFFKENADRIYIISGGFHEFILPIAQILGIADSHILANRFIWDGEKAIGFDKENSLSKKGGKVMAVKKLGLKGKVVVIGDGFTDYEIKKKGAADVFIAFCENVRRESVATHADVVVCNFNEIISFLVK